MTYQTLTSGHSATDSSPSMKKISETQDPILPRIDSATLQICDSVLNCTGATPLIRLDRLAKKYGLKCNLLAKMEHYNPGGSVKDRIALRMIVEAEKAGILVPGKSVIIEPTSGNTGIGIALAAAVKNYRCIIVMPQKMSREKINTLKALGAEIVRTPTEAGHDSPEGNLAVASRLQKAIPNGVILDQYDPATHFETTALEIIQAIENTPSKETKPSSGVVDVFIAGAGTGGTISGVSKRLKSHYGADKTKTIAVDPIGSTLAKPESLNEVGVQFYKVEGTGYDFAPDVLDYSIIDQWVKVSDSDSFKTLKEIIKVEGALCGGSSGQAVCAALNYLKPDLDGKGPGQGWEQFGQFPHVNVVVICADSLRNYVTKDWLIEGCEHLETTEADIISKINSSEACEHLETSESDIISKINSTHLS